MKAVVTITGDMLTRNDDSPTPGRILLLSDCPCDVGPIQRHVRVIGRIGRGRWQVEHTHGAGWTARPLPPSGTAR